MDVCCNRLMLALFAAIIVLLVTLDTARATPVHGLNASAIAEASIVEKSVIIHRTPRRNAISAAGTDTLEQALVKRISSS
jgi:hypothetical protein